MPNTVASGALLACSFGSVPSLLTVLPAQRVRAEGHPLATIDAHVPLVNVKPFGLCASPSNPQVAAALGAPQPCVPITTQPWQSGSASVRAGRRPVLRQVDRCLCQWGGVISVTDPACQRTRAG